jgi:hypothetical protein
VPTIRSDELQRPDLAAFVRHAALYGDEIVVETAREMCTAYANRLRLETIPPPVDITWMVPADRDRLLDERIAAREAFRAELIAMKRDLERLPAEIALARAKAGKTKTAQTPRRRTTPALREQVLALHERGLVVSAIGNTLNVSDRRVRELLAPAGNRRNGGRQASVHAEIRANSALALVPGGVT